MNLNKEKIWLEVRAERWILVDVAIAPSTITITEVGGNQIAECRVRYLSFLGIGRDVIEPARLQAPTDLCAEHSLATQDEHSHLRRFPPRKHPTA